MHLYLRKSNELEVLITRKAEGPVKEELLGLTVFRYETTPFISTDEDISLLEENAPPLKKHFLKATIQTRPRFNDLHYGSNFRAFGVYELGDARAELTPADANTAGYLYSIIIETKTWKGIEDMQTLQERLWAGTIVPTTSYDRPQKKLNPIQEFKLFLGTRKLPWFKKFIFALRLMRTS